MTINPQDIVLINIDRGRAYAKGWHQGIEHQRKLYNLDHYALKPKQGETQFQDPIYPDTVDLAVGMILANSLTIRATQLVGGPNTDESNSNVEKFLAGIIENAGRDNEYDLMYELLLHHVRDGGCVLYTIWDDALAQQIRTTGIVNEQDEDGTVISAEHPLYEYPPLLVQVIDPLSVILYPGNGPHRWGMVGRVEKANALQVYERYEGWVSPRLTSYSASTLRDITGDLIDYWDYVFEGGKFHVRNAVLWEDEFIRPPTIQEDYDEIPYTIGLYKPTSRTDTREWGGILTPMVPAVSALERAFNRRQRQIDLFSAMPLVTKTREGRAVQVDPAFGQPVNIGPDEDVGFPRWEGNPPDVDRQIAFLSNRVQQSGFTESFFGSGLSDSGFALSQNGDQNRIRLTQPIVHYQRMLGWWAEKVLRLVTKKAEPDAYFEVYGFVKGREFYDAIPVGEFSGHHISVKMRPEFPNEKVRNHAMANQVRNILSDETIIEDYLGYEQPNDEVQRRLLSQIMQTAPVQQYAVMAELTKMAQSGDDMAKLILAAYQANGLPGTPGRPAEQQNMEQGRGIQTVPPKLPGGVE